jgi:hypothetical protein
MVYGPIAAILVEMFPTRIRYTGMSLPYHIGNGWFGGLLPATVFAMSAAAGDIYYGLWYPIAICGHVAGYRFALRQGDAGHRSQRWRLRYCANVEKGRGACAPAFLFRVLAYPTSLFGQLPLRAEARGRMRSAATKSDAALRLACVAKRRWATNMVSAEGPARNRMADARGRQFSEPAGVCTQVFPRPDCRVIQNCNKKGPHKAGLQDGISKEGFMRPSCRPSRSSRSEPELPSRLR